MSVTGARVRSAAAAKVLCGATLFASACALPWPVQQQRVESSIPATAPVAAEIAAVEAAVVAEVNGVRAGEGLRALDRVRALDRAARSHAEELARRGRLEHESIDPQRLTPGARVTAEGVEWMGVAENLAAMTDNGAGVGRRSAMIWFGSASHRVNMLNSTYTQTGVGVAVDRRGVWYVTQLYVLPRR